MRILILLILISISCSSVKRINSDFESGNQNMEFNCYGKKIQLSNISFPSDQICIIINDMFYLSEYDEAIYDLLQCAFTSENIEEIKFTEYLKNQFEYLHHIVENNSTYFNTYCVIGLIENTLINSSLSEFNDLLYKFSQLDICYAGNIDYVHIGKELSLIIIYEYLNFEERKKFTRRYIEFKDFQQKFHSELDECNRSQELNKFLEEYVSKALSK